MHTDRERDRRRDAETDIARTANVVRADLVNGPAELLLLQQPIDQSAHATLHGRLVDGIRTLHPHCPSLFNI